MTKDASTVGGLYDKLLAEAEARPIPRRKWLKKYSMGAFRPLAPDVFRNAVGVRDVLDNIFMPEEKYAARLAEHPQLVKLLAGLNTPWQPFAEAMRRTQILAREGVHPGAHRTLYAAADLDVMQGQWDRYDLACQEGFAPRTAKALLHLPEGTLISGIHFPTGRRFSEGHVHHRLEGGHHWVIAGVEDSTKGIVGPQAQITAPHSTPPGGPCDLGAWVFRVD